MAQRESRPSRADPDGFFDSRYALQGDVAGSLVDVEGQIDAEVLARIAADDAEMAARIAAIDAHTARADNPHVVTKTQVGLSVVPNLDARPRSTHSGTQTASTISDFATTVAVTAHVKGGTDVPIADGGTGASTASVALTNLGAAAAAALTTHTANVANPHVVTKAQVGLANANDTSDSAKPVSTATQAALDTRAPLAHHHAVPWQSGLYYSSMSFPGLGKQSVLDVQLIVNRHCAVPFYSPGGAITALGVAITAAVAGSIRCFVYSMGADGKPATYLVGTANLSTATVGGVEGAVTYTFPKPDWYYLVCAASAAASLRFFVPTQSPLGQLSPGSGELYAMYSKDEASTSPTSSFGTATGQVSIAPIISVKAA